MIKKGEDVQKDLDTRISQAVDDAVSSIYPVSRKEFNELKKDVDAMKGKKKTTRKKTSRKKATKKATKKAR